MKKKPAAKQTAPKKLLASVEKVRDMSPTDLEKASGGMKPCYPVSRIPCG